MNRKLSGIRMQGLVSAHPLVINSYQVPGVRDFVFQEPKSFPNLASKHDILCKFAPTRNGSFSFRELNECKTIPSYPFFLKSFPTNLEWELKRLLVGIAAIYRRFPTFFYADESGMRGGRGAGGNLTPFYLTLNVFPMHLIPAFFLRLLLWPLEKSLLLPWL